MFSSKPLIAIKVLTRFSGLFRAFAQIFGPGLRAVTKPRPAQALIIIIEAAVCNVIIRVTTAVKALAFFKSRSRGGNNLAQV